MAPATITVITVPGPAPVASIIVTPNAPTLSLGDLLSLTASVRDSAGVELTGRTVTWTSSVPAVASVSSIGTVTALSAGTALITARSGSVTGVATITVSSTTSPRLVFTSVSAGNVDADICGVTSGGAAYCWGRNTFGELGNGTTAGSAVPVPVAGGVAFTYASAAEFHTCGITAVGRRTAGVTTARANLAAIRN